MAIFSAQQIPYKLTQAFSTIVTDYIEQAPLLSSFYEHSPDLQGIKNAILHRKSKVTNRTLLVNQLKAQYAGMALSEAQQGHIESLLLENTFTITTAHQPNIFTGHLYFIYKILHCIKLAEELKQQLPEYNFVPVYYMGSEDADLEELGAVTINGKKYTWDTKQKGAVGRMLVDKAFILLIDAIEGQISVEPFGKEILQVVRNAYILQKTIQQATLELVHTLFSAYGLLILLPDNAALKKEFSPVIRRELTEQFSNKAVMETMQGFPSEYKVQAAGRELNLFYLKDDSRERIEKGNGQWSIVKSSVKFDEKAILEELDNHPERFSPNVILRPLYQEMTLPNIAFIGGGGELAYWLELKKVFEATGIPYPVLVLRNSFMIVNKKTAEKTDSLQININQFFKPAHEVILHLVQQSSALQLQLTEEKKQLEALYVKIKHVASIVDETLEKHSDALFAKAHKKIAQLEKKMLLAEKKKFEAQQRQVQKIKSLLFPSNNLQERVDNLLPYYATYGPAFIEMLYQHSKGLQQKFTILTETD